MEEQQAGRLPRSSWGGLRQDASSVPPMALCTEGTTCASLLLRAFAGATLLVSRCLGRGVLGGHDLLL